MSNYFSGLKAWYWQRISAVFLLLSFCYIGGSFALLNINDFYSWVSWARSTFNSLIIISTAIALNYHAWVGFRDIILDYVKSSRLKIFLLTIFAIGAIAMPLWILIILF